MGYKCQVCKEMTHHGSVGETVDERDVQSDASSLTDDERLVVLLLRSGSMEKTRLDLLLSLAKEIARGRHRYQESMHRGLGAGALPQVGEEASREIEEKLSKMLAALEQRDLVKPIEYRIGLTDYGRAIVKWLRENPLDDESLEEKKIAKILLTAFRRTSTHDLMMFLAYEFKEIRNLGKAFGFPEDDRLRKVVDVGRIDGLFVYRFDREDLRVFLDGLTE